MNNVRIKIGEFEFNTEIYTLSSSNNEQVLEPRVGQLLFYLYQNKERFISLEELHENVWGMTVVSDTAVRRSISKLRQAFDDDASNPKYIKSLAKRGYQLIASIETISEEESELEHSIEILNVSGGSGLVDHAEHSSFLAFFKNLYNTTYRLYRNHLKTAFSIVFLTLILLSTLFLIREPLFTEDSKPSAPLLDSSHLKFIQSNHSNKLSMALSINKQLLAFTGNVDGKDTSALYLEDLKTNSVTSLTDSSAQVEYVDFVSNDTAVVYSRVVGNTSSIVYQGVLNPKSQRTLYSSMGVKFGGISSIPGQNSFFVIISNEEVTESSIYRIDIDSGQIDPITSHAGHNIFDVTLKVSSSGKYLSFVRWSDNEYSLRIIDVNSGKKIKTFSLDNPVSSMAWQSDDSLLILDTNTLWRLDLKENANEKLFKNANNLARNIFHLDYNQILVSIDNPLEISVGMSPLKEINHNSWSVKESSDLVSIRYGWKPHLLVTLNNREQGYEILVKDTRSNTSKVLVKSLHDLILRDVNQVSGDILYEEDGQLWLYSTAQEHAIPITKASQYVSSASFSYGGQGVEYCQRRLTKYTCHNYNIADQSTDLVIDNVRGLKSTSDGYLVSRPQGAVEMLDGNFNVTSSLPFTIDYFTHRALDVTDEYVIYSRLHSSSNQIETSIYHRDSGHLETILNNYDTLSHDFDVSPDGKSIMRIFKGFRTSDLYKMTDSALKR